MTPVPGAVVMAWWERRRRPPDVLGHDWPPETAWRAWHRAVADLERELGPALKVLVERSRVQQRHRDAAEKYIQELEEKVKRAVDGGAHE